MTDLPEPAADEAANASTADDETASTSAAVADDDLIVVTQAPAKPRRRRSFVRRFGISFVLGFVLVVIVGVGGMYAWSQQYDGRILPGVRVGVTELGGLSRGEAEARIANAYEGLSVGKITLTGPDGQTMTLNYEDVGRGPDMARMIDVAFAAGRHGQPIADLIGGSQVAIHGITLDAVVAYDQDRLAVAIGTLASTLDRTPSNAFVTVADDGSFGVTAATDGRTVDQTALLAALDRELSAIQAPAEITLTVPVTAAVPAVSTASAEEAKAAADRMTADVVISRGEDRWTVKRASLAPLVSFQTGTDGRIDPVIADAGLDPIVEDLAGDVNQKVKNAGLKLVGSHVVATHTSQEGRTLDPLGMKAVIINEMRARARGAAARTVDAVVEAVDPKLTTADAEAMAPRMKLKSSYSVFYWPIINNHYGGNIEAPATKINGTVVPAGATFDFWKAVGDLRKLPGTGPGNAIEGGKITVTGAFGGGICTTSTTLFNAAFRAGMIPLARKNHNEYITRYPAGLDATVWIVGKTKQTMSFKNDTEYPILITRTITRTGNKRWLTFKVWTVPNGRKATVTNTVIKHGPKARATIVRDPSKPVGYSYLNNAPADGAKVWTTVTIYDHGKVHWTKRYYSNYPAVDGVTIVGTKESATTTAD